MKSLVIVSAILLSALSIAKADSESFADVYCKAKYEKFKDGSPLYTDSGIDIVLNNVPEKYKKCKITKSTYRSEEPIKFKIKEDGVVLIVIHEHAVEKYTSDGWNKKEEIECIDNNAREGLGKKKFFLLSKHYVKGEYEMKAEPLFGIHLIM